VDTETMEALAKYQEKYEKLLRESESRQKEDEERLIVRSSGLTLLSGRLMGEFVCRSCKTCRRRCTRSLPTRTSSTARSVSAFLSASSRAC
jgi:hypothetical protein